MSKGMRPFICVYLLLTQVITYDPNKWHQRVPPVLRDEIGVVGKRGYTPPGQLSWAETELATKPIESLTLMDLRVNSRSGTQ